MSDSIIDTDEYVRQIINAVKNSTPEDAADFVTHLVNEYGAKSQKLGRREFAEQIAALARS